MLVKRGGVCKVTLMLQKLHSSRKVVYYRIRFYRVSGDMYAEKQMSNLHYAGVTGKCILSYLSVTKVTVFEKVDLL